MNQTISVVLIVVGFIILFTALFFYAASKTTLGLIFTGLGVLGMLGGFLTGMITESKAVDSKIDSVNSTYGIELTKDELAELEYPFNKPDTSKVVKFGTLEQSSITNGELKSDNITLAWNGSEMQLFQSDDEEELGSELPRAEK